MYAFQLLFFFNIFFDFLQFFRKKQNSATFFSFERETVHRCWLSAIEQPLKHDRLKRGSQFTGAIVFKNSLWTERRKGLLREETPGPVQRRSPDL
jgi:hypothetical protein